MDKEYRLKKFIEEYGELTKKYRIDFASYPMFTPDGQGTFKIVCQTTPVDLDEIKQSQDVKKYDDEFIKKDS